MHTISYSSPNFDERLHQPDMIIIHYTDMMSAQESLERLIDPSYKVSAHYLIDEDGTIYQLVAEKNRAWHAGLSYWKGRENINHHSIGIELQNKGHSNGGPEPFPDDQMKALVQLIHNIRTRWIIPNNFILAHSDIAPARKVDPGAGFDWKRLAREGIGIYPNNDQSIMNLEYPIIEMQQILREIGYECHLNNIFDKVTMQIVEAFQRHWAPYELGKGLTPFTQNQILEIKKLSTFQ